MARRTELSVCQDGHPFFDAESCITSGIVLAVRDSEHDNVVLGAAGRLAAEGVFAADVSAQGDPP